MPGVGVPVSKILVPLLAQRNVLLTLHVVRRWLRVFWLADWLALITHFPPEIPWFFVWFFFFWSLLPRHTHTRDSGKFTGISNTEINCHVVCQWRKSCEFVAWPHRLGSFFCDSSCRFGIVLARANFILAVLDQLPSLWRPSPSNLYGIEDSKISIGS